MSRSKPLASLLVVLAVSYLNVMNFAQQEPDTAWEVRPKVNAAIDLVSRTRIQVWGELQDGANFSFNRWRTGALLTYRLKPILKLHLRDIDEDRNHYPVFGGGYEYLHTVQNGSTKNENRISGGVQFPFKNLLLLDLYVLHQNQNPVNMLGTTLNFYFNNVR
jgi:hypothetical protein